MSEINLEFLLGAMPAAEAALYRVLIQLIPAPSPEAPNRGGRQIEMALLAKLTGYTKRWVIELMQRLEDKNFIRTDGGSGAVKWIWLLPPGVLRLGKSYPTKLARRKKTSPGKAKAPRAAAPRPKHRRKETAPSPKADAEVNIASPVEKAAEIPARRRKGPTPSIPPAGPAPYNPVMPATALIPPPPAPVNPMLPAGMMPPPATPPGGPAPDNPVVAATTVTPAPSRARRDAAARSPRARRATKIGPSPSMAPGGLTAGNPVVPAAVMPAALSAAPGGPGAGNRVVIATRVPPAPPSPASGNPAPGNPMRAAKVAPPPPSTAPGIPVVPAARVTPFPPEPAALAIPAKRISPRKSTKKLPAGRSHWESAPIEELVAYAYSQPVTPEFIHNLKTPGMSGGLLVLALERLCQRIERYGLMPYTDRWSLVTALRTILIDL